MRGVEEGDDGLARAGRGVLVEACDVMCSVSTIIDMLLAGAGGKQCTDDIDLACPASHHQRRPASTGRRLDVSAASEELVHSSKVAMEAGYIQARFITRTYRVNVGAAAK